MSINASIPLAGQNPGIFEAATQGYSYGRQLAQQELMNPIQLEAMKNQNALQKEEANKLAQQNQIASQRLVHDTAVQLRKLPLDQRSSVAQKAIPQLQAMGIDTSSLNLDEHLTDQELDTAINSLAPLINDPNKKFASKSVAGNQILSDENGTAYASNTIFDPSTGGISLVKTALGPSSALINRAGLTAEESMANQVALAQQKADIARISAINQAYGLVDPSARRVGAEVATKETVERDNDVLETGLASVEAIPKIDESLELLRKVKTGGISKNAKAVADYLGLNTTDESLLQAQFANNIVTIMQAQKGVQTKADQDLIEKTSANFSLGSDANIALLERMKRGAERRVASAKKVASSNEIYAKDLERLNQDYSVRPQAKPQSANPTAAPKRVRWSDLGD